MFFIYKKGDLVTRKSYNHDTVFKIINIKNGIYYLKGAEVRLYANSPEEDLQIYQEEINYDDAVFAFQNFKLFDRDEYFYLPAKILHIDGDNDYLKRCLNFYKNVGIKAIGKKVSEKDTSVILSELLQKIKPDILIITGHDAYYRKKNNQEDISNYKNSLNFVNSVKIARKYEKSHEKLIIIAGACQSNYEELIKAGANYASSPKRVNIHALDPAIIATTIALTEKSDAINLVELLNKTKYGKDGMGGLKGNGMMYVGYPR